MNSTLLMLRALPKLFAEEVWDRRLVVSVRHDSPRKDTVVVSAPHKEGTNGPGVRDGVPLAEVVFEKQRTPQVRWHNKRKRDPAAINAATDALVPVIILRTLYEMLDKGVDWSHLVIDVSEGTNLGEMWVTISAIPLSPDVHVDLWFDASGKVLKR